MIDRERIENMGNISRLKQVSNVIKNEALIEAEPSLSALSSNLDITNGGSIYYGTGLTTPRAISIGLPFDVIGMVLVAERIRKVGNLDQIFHHIADTHAKTNEWIDPQEVDRRAKTTRDTLQRMAHNFKLDKFNVSLSSEFDNTSDYQEMLKKFEDLPSKANHEYVTRELSDIEWYRNKHKMLIKVGWIIQATETGLGFDERLYDRKYAEIYPDQISFIYTKPGRTFDKSRPKASPYIQIEGETRLLLKKEENVKAKMDEVIKITGDPFLGGSRKHLENIVRLYERLFGSMGRISLEDKIQAIIDKATS